MTQPKALYLADVLEYIPDNINKAAAAELRRLHAECEHHKAWVAHITAENKSLEAQRDALRTIEPLYTAPPPRKPLTEGEISNIWDGHIVPIFGKNGINPVVFARAIERVHNIKE